MTYLYPYISIYRGPKKGEELRKYLISHMKGIDEVSFNSNKINNDFQETLKLFSSLQSNTIRQISHLKSLIGVLQQIEEESKVLEA